MSNATDILDGEGDAIRSALAAGVMIAEPDKLDSTGRFFSVLVPPNSKQVVVDLEKLRDDAGLEEHPRRKTGTQVVHDPESFASYVTKHGLPETEVWADVTAQRLTAVINAGMGVTGDGVEDYAGWRDYRVTYRLQPTPAWAEWCAEEGKMLSQLDFAQHVEDHLVDFVSPSGADMLEMAQTFIANRKVKFESSKRLKSSETQLEYREETDATAGSKGRLTIPDTFSLGIVPFEGSAPYKVTARLRYRIHDSGVLQLGYRLNRPEDIARQAFADIVESVKAGITQPIWYGLP